MSIRDNVPEKIQQSSSADRFISVLDGLDSFKKEVIAVGLRSFNSAVCLSKSWLIKKLDSYGIPDFPQAIPMEVLIQFILNCQTITYLRGSKRGIVLYCSVLSLGEVIIDDSAFYVDSPILLLNSFNHGEIVDATDSKVNYLVDDSDMLNQEASLSVSISSKYFNGDYPIEEAAIKEYIESTLPNYLGFTANKKIIYNYTPREEFYYDSLLNPYFV